MLKIILYALAAAINSHRQLALENVALRHQLEVLQRNAKRPLLKPSDRALWAFLSRFLPDWRRHLSIVQPEMSFVGTEPVGGFTGVGGAIREEADPRFLSRFDL